MGKGDWTRVAGTVVPIFLDPQDKTSPADRIYQDWLATTNYAANWLMFRDCDMTFVGIPDGTSNTIMFTTRYQVCGDVPTAWAYNRLCFTRA